MGVFKNLYSNIFIYLFIESLIQYLLLLLYIENHLYSSIKISQQKIRGIIL